MCISVCFLIGVNLTLLQEDVEVNVSTSQDFTVLCHITQQSSADSEFQVTWFWQEKSAENQRRAIFTAYRNATLQAFEKSDQLRFSRPLHNNYSLTVSKAAPQDAGVYFCEVEEWLPSPSHGWRKMATQRSGRWTVDIGPTVHPLGKGFFELHSECSHVADVRRCLICVSFFVQEMWTPLLTLNARHLHGS